MADDPPAWPTETAGAAISKSKTPANQQVVEFNFIEPKTKIILIGIKNSRFASTASHRGGVGGKMCVRRNQDESKVPPVRDGAELPASGFAFHGRFALHHARKPPPKAKAPAVTL
jgi:hypothetical protein